MRKREDIEEALRLLHWKAKRLLTLNQKPTAHSCMMVGEVNAICWILKRRIPGIDPGDMDEMIDDIREEFNDEKLKAHT